MIPLLILFLATLIAGIITSILQHHGAENDLYDLYIWGLRLLGKAITVIILINAVWIGLQTIGLLK